MARLESTLHRAVSSVLDTFSSAPPTRREDNNAYYRNGGDAAYSAAVMAAVGRELVRALGRPPRILDVGCGKRMSAACIVSSMGNAEYACIDREMPPPALHAEAELKRVCGHSVIELRCDVFEDDLTGLLPMAHYDLVIIDIEPHGREIDAYEKVRDFLTETHVCLLKHIADMGMCGSIFADNFLERYHAERCVADYYGVRVLNNWNMRDVYAIMTRAPTDAREAGSTTQSMVCARMRSTGAKFDDWTSNCANQFVVSVNSFGELRWD